MPPFLRDKSTIIEKFQEPPFSPHCLNLGWFPHPPLKTGPCLYIPTPSQIQKQAPPPILRKKYYETHCM